jgi:hypothetical protein
MIVSVDGSVTVTSAVTFENGFAEKPLFVNCPIVAEVGQPFSCSFAATAGTADVKYTEGADPAVDSNFVVPRKSVLNFWALALLLLLMGQCG